MNAAAKAIHQSNLFSGQLSDMRLPKLLQCLFILLCSLLISALAIIYSINEYRSSFNQLQQLQHESQQLHLQYGQLLLEQASLATPARVEYLAVQKLQMHLPTEKDILLLKQHEE